MMIKWAAFFFLYAISALLIAANANSPHAGISIQARRPVASLADADSAIDNHVCNPAPTRNLSIGIMTWNLAERSPTMADCSFMKEFKDCDIVALAIQECEDLRPRRQEGRRSKKWRELHRKVFGKRYECIAAHKFGGLQLVLYANKKAAKVISGVQTIEVACGLGNVLSNKGGIGIILRMHGAKTLAFINAHMAAHQHMVEARNADYHRIATAMMEKTFRRWQRPLSSLSKSKSKSKNAAKAKSISHSKAADSIQSDSHMLAHCFDGIFFFGDLNYRLELPRLEIELFCEDYRQSAPHQPALQSRLQLDPSLPGYSLRMAELLGADQLTSQRHRQAVFRHFQEPSIAFPPSFKYDKGSTCFDSSGKQRCPAYTDRVLFSQQPGLQLRAMDYYSPDARSSDHRPVCAKFSCQY